MTKHEIIIGNSNNMKAIPDGTVNLIVTSPPYPMIEMWDEMFSSQHPAIRNDLESGNGMAAFERCMRFLMQYGRSATVSLQIMDLCA